MRGALTISFLLLSLASITDGARVERSSDAWVRSFDSFINRAAQARAAAQATTDMRQRWVTVRELMAETSQAAGEGEIAMQELGQTFDHIDQEIEDNELHPLLDGEFQVADLRALRNGNALVRISREFVSTGDDLVTLSHLTEVMVETLVAVLDLTESVGELAPAWRGVDTHRARQLTGRVSSLSERFSVEAQKLHEADEQLKPLEGWDEMGRWGKARVVATNFNQLRRGLRGVRQSKHTLEELYTDEASSTMSEVVSVVQSMRSAADRFGGR